MTWPFTQLSRMITRRRLRKLLIRRAQLAAEMTAFRAGGYREPVTEGQLAVIEERIRQLEAA